MIEQIFVSGIIGAGVGYITNDLALKLMFSGIGPIAPKIAENKEGLGQSLGRTVSGRLVPEQEEDKQILLKKLQEEEIQDALRFAVDDWLKNILPEKFGELHFGEIQGFDQTAAGLQELLTDFFRQNTAEIIEKITSEIDISTVLTDRQQDCIFDHLFQILMEEVEHSPLNQYVDQMIQDNTDICLTDILGARTDIICSQLSKKCAAQTIEEICNCPDQMERMLKSINLEGAIYYTLLSLANEPLSSLLGNNTIEAFVKQNRTVIKKAVASKDFRNVLTALVREILELLHDVKIPLYQIFPINEQNKLNDYLSKKLPDIMPYLLDYLRDKQNDISKLVDRAVNSVIDGKTSNFIANGIRSTFRDTILREVRKIDVIQKIEQMSDSFLKSDDAVQQCRQMLEDFLKKTTVADIIKLLDERGLLNAEKFGQILFDLCNQYIDHIPKKFYEMAGTVRLSDWVDVQKISLSSCSEQISRWCIGQLKDSSKVRQKAEETCEKVIYSKADELLHTPLGKLITPGMRTGILRSADGSRLAAWMGKNRPEWIQKLKAWVLLRIRGKSVYSLLTRSKIRQSSEGIIQKVQYSFRNVVESIRNTQIADYARRLAHSQVSKDFASYLQNMTIPVVQKNREAVKRSLTEIISKRIENLDTRQIGEMMSEFMGKEMRPLCTLGAWLGAAVGIGMGVFSAIRGVPVGLCAWIIRSFVFAVIGIITNKLAFVGLFKPYEPKEGFLWRLWNHGYIPAHKKNVAHQFGVFVQNNMLNGDTISKWLQNELPKWEKELPQMLLKNNCAGLYCLLKENHDAIASYTAYSIQSKIKRESDHVSEAILKEFGQTKIQEFLTPEMVEDAAGSILQQLRCHPEQLYTELEKLLQAERPLGSVLSFSKSLLQKWISSETESFLKNHAEEYLSFETLLKLTEEHDPYQKYCQKPLDELLMKFGNSELIPQWSEKLAGFMLDKLFSPEGSRFICDKITELLNQSLDEKQTVATIFDGQLRKAMDGGITSITDTIVVYIQQNLQSSRYDIQRSVIREIKNSVPRLKRAAVDADNMAAHVVTRLIDRELPSFFKKEIYNISQVLRNFFEHEIYTIRISSIQLDARKLDFASVVCNTLGDPQAKQRVRSHANQLSGSILSAVFRQKLDAFANILNIQRLSDVLWRFERQTKDLLENLRSLICDTDRTANAVSEYVYRIVERAVLDVSIADITGAVSADDLKDAVKNTVQFLLNQASVHEYLQSRIRHIDQTHREDNVRMYLDDFDARRSIQEILKDEKLLQPVLEEQCDLAVRFFISDHFACIAQPTQKQMADLLISSGLQTVEVHLQYMLEAIKIDHVIEQIVLEMDGKSIHAMFQEFATPYFNKLIIYGFFGGVVVIGEAVISNLIEIYFNTTQTAAFRITDVMFATIIFLCYCIKICSTKRR